MTNDGWSEFKLLPSLNEKLIIYIEAWRLKISKSKEPPLNKSIFSLRTTLSEREQDLLPLFPSTTASHFFQTNFVSWKKKRQKSSIMSPSNKNSPVMQKRLTPKQQSPSPRPRTPSPPNSMGSFHTYHPPSTSPIHFNQSHHHSFEDRGELHAHFQPSQISPATPPIKQDHSPTSVSLAQIHPPPPSMSTPSLASSTFPTTNINTVNPYLSRSAPSLGALIPQSYQPSVQQSVSSTPGGYAQRSPSLPPVPQYYPVKIESNHSYGGPTFHSSCSSVSGFSAPELKRSMENCSSTANFYGQYNFAPTTMKPLGQEPSSPSANPAQPLFSSHYGAVEVEENWY